MSSGTVGRSSGYDVEREVRERYAEGAAACESSLCCATTYDPERLKLLPAEIIEKDYGCGDPTRYVKRGESVVDLGSGGGKACYLMAREVGADGRVIGVDFNDAMLGLARKYQAEMAEKLGYANTRFVKGRIQDLALDLDKAQAVLAGGAVSSVEDLAAFEAACDRLRREEPMIETESVDVVVSNCVLNLVKPEEKAKLFDEIFRVLRVGGRAVISDIVCDEPPTESIMNDPKLWSGCVSGAFVEGDFLRRFADAGFYGIEILERSGEPWQTIEGVEFRAMTVVAHKGKQGVCLERKQAVVYKGPWREVRDDDGHVFRRGERVAVCDKTYRLMTNEHGPYGVQVIGIDPVHEIPLEEAELYDCSRRALRHPRETKGADYDVTTEADSCCGPDGCC
ncbi:methyltransferase domain-containing protein [Mucisphaera calidilacus]|uniref:Arsenite methyltransferase n=1 Tax=Mucisphaera calidilacus TaxID=2527982 RepID=A0A518BYR6_9BACT|nr:methyltransferase domain-containing protein [Mucisphaera calidilacus]QDU72119.1 arsenite S-adenosylmethyltransferase [Mucisphaera calidilacus]